MRSCRGLRARRLPLHPLRQTQEHQKAESKTGRGLQVHHVGEGSFRDRQHDLDKLVTLCEVCHRRVRKKKMR
jgi:hypothetical protein